jgi:hypothetical protein
MQLLALNLVIGIQVAQLRNVDDLDEPLAQSDSEFETGNLTEVEPVKELILAKRVQASYHASPLALVKMQVVPSCTDE